MSTSSIEQYEERKEARQNRIRKVYGLTMGSLIVLIGLSVLFADKLGIEFVIGLDPLMRYGFGGLCLLYGGFRLWRSFQP